MKRKTKKRPTDLTLRNLRAANKKIKLIKNKNFIQDANLRSLYVVVGSIEKRVKAVEDLIKLANPYFRAFKKKQ